jgi:putative membrane protein
MSDENSRDATDEPPRPRVVMMEAPDASDERGSDLLAPQVIATGETGRLVAAAPAARRPVAAGTALVRRGSRVVRLGLAGVATAFVGWLGVDAYLWVAAAFERSAALGWVASAAVAAGVGGATLVIARELRSFLALRHVEADQQRIAEQSDVMRPADMQAAIRHVLAAIPKDRESEAAIEVFQRKVQRHHSPGQQIALVSSTVLAPFDRRAEAIVRRAATRAFAISAISPTALTDAVFFGALSVRMVREIAGCYGHRPTAAATVHLLRRLAVEAGKLGAIDLAAATFSQHLAGAVAERLATSAAESVYAAQRMARLGLVTMQLCRPVPFQPEEIPGIMTSLIGNLLRGDRRARDDEGT